VQGTKGDGVFAARQFGSRETVVVGRIEAELSANDQHASQIGPDRFVMHGGLLPKVNHSCEPNCGIRVNESGAHNLVALRPIAVGEEITYDYAMGNYSIDFFPVQCRCGEPNCRGRITGWKDLPARRRVEYDGFVAPYLSECVSPAV